MFLLFYFAFFIIINAYRNAETYQMLQQAASPTSVVQPLKCDSDNNFEKSLYDLFNSGASDNIINEDNFFEIANIAAELNYKKDNNNKDCLHRIDTFLKRPVNESISSGVKFWRIRSMLFRILSHYFFINGNSNQELDNPEALVNEIEYGESNLLSFALHSNYVVGSPIYWQTEAMVIDSLLESEQLYEKPHKISVFLEFFDKELRECAENSKNIKTLMINIKRLRFIEEQKTKKKDNLYGARAYCFMLSLWYDKSAILLLNNTFLHFKLDENKEYVRIRVYSTNISRTSDGFLESLPFLHKCNC
eukprot:GHVR01104955.1.p1 GENE.GHVR01104955.1~~GHVR01104955.1.p1  ORF type:complete len:305 (+),score=14.16 GHVR01104955.1:31-945(+)